MNIEHHVEQMEAARRDFRVLWETKLRQRAFNLIDMSKATAREDGVKRLLMFAEDIAWQSFLHALEIRRGPKQ